MVRIACAPFRFIIFNFNFNFNIVITGGHFSLFRGPETTSVALKVCQRLKDGE
jgi:hypothetical protein